MDPVAKRREPRLPGPRLHARGLREGGRQDSRSRSLPQVEEPADACCHGLHEVVRHRADQLLQVGLVDGRDLGCVGDGVPAQPCPAPWQERVARRPRQRRIAREHANHDSVDTAGVASSDCRASSGQLAVLVFSRLTLTTTSRGRSVELASTFRKNPTCLGEGSLSLSPNVSRAFERWVRAAPRGRHPLMWPAART